MDVALETVNLLWMTSVAVPWDQINIGDDRYEGGEFDWKSVFIDRFRNEFSCELDSV